MFVPASGPRCKVPPYRRWGRRIAAVPWNWTWIALRSKAPREELHFTGRTHQNCRRQFPRARRRAVAVVSGMLKRRSVVEGTWSLVSWAAEGIREALRAGRPRFIEFWAEL
jgi:hypothetical protein